MFLGKSAGNGKAVPLHILNLPLPTQPCHLPGCGVRDDGVPFFTQYILYSLATAFIPSASMTKGQFASG